MHNRIFLLELRVTKLGLLEESTIWNEEGNGTPLQYSCLENPMGGGACLATVDRVAKSWT